GIYHSIYDDFYFYTRFLDRDFLYGRALAQTAGSAVIRLADSDVLPFDFTNLSNTVDRYAKELKDLLSRKQDEVKERNRQIDEGVFAIVADPRRPVAPPKTQPVPPALNFAPLDNAASALSASAQRYQKAFAAAGVRLAQNGQRLQALNGKLRRAE